MSSSSPVVTTHRQPKRVVSTDRCVVLCSSSKKIIPQRHWNENRNRHDRSCSLMRSVVVLCVILPLMLLLESVPMAQGSFSMVVESSETECFVIRVPGQQLSTISGNYDCLDDELSPDPVSVMLYDSHDDVVWHSTPGEAEGTFHVLGVGRHKLCIQNGVDWDALTEEEREHLKAERKALREEEEGEGEPDDDITDDEEQFNDGMDRTVGFAVRVRAPKRVLPDEEEGPDEQRARNLLDLTQALTEDLETMMDHQEYLRNREASHRDLTEQTFSRIVRWTVLEAIVLVLISTGQVMYLRKFFETRRYL